MYRVGSHTLAKKKTQIVLQESRFRITTFASAAAFSAAAFSAAALASASASALAFASAAALASAAAFQIPPQVSCKVSSPTAFFSETDLGD
jgi:hypothetical protein